MLGIMKSCTFSHKKILVKNQPHTYLHAWCQERIQTFGKGTQSQNEMTLQERYKPYLRVHDFSMGSSQFYLTVVLDRGDCSVRV